MMLSMHGWIFKTGDKGISYTGWLKKASDGVERAVGTRQMGLRWPTVSLYAHGYTKKKGECREGLGVRSCLGYSGRQEEKWNLSCPQGHLFLTAAPVSAVSPPTPTFLMRHKKWRVRKVLEMLKKYIHLGLLLVMAIVHHLRSSTGPEANFQILLTYATAGLQPYICLQFDQKIVIRITKNCVLQTSPGIFQSPYWKFTYFY